MPRRVLLVTSSYAPTMIADMHRTRMLAWELPSQGWDVEILCPDQTYQLNSYLDDDSAAFFAPDAPIHWVGQRFERLSRMIGLGSIGWRAIVPMFLAGNALFRRKPFDLVFISTAKFPLFLLGPMWRKWLGVPFILDLHDPCYRNEAQAKRESLKQIATRWLAKRIESNAIPAAVGLISVSPNYIETMRGRYAQRNPEWMNSGNHAVLPFAARPQDLAEAAKGTTVARQSANGVKTIVYVGAGGPIMARAFDVLCRSLARLRTENPELIERIRIELYGTMLGWQPGNLRHLADIATKNGLSNIVTERPDRVTYRRSLELLLESDGALVLGVDDAGYMPSKLFTYALSGKPLLASLHRDGPAFAEFQKRPALGHVLWFGQSNNQEIPASDALSEVRAFLDEVLTGRTFDRRKLLAPNLSVAMAQRHAAAFEACLQTTYRGARRSTAHGNASASMSRGAQIN